MLPEMLAGTLVLRPYVFAFLAAFLVMAFRDLGPRRALGWLGLGFAVAFGAEYASTRTGFPFGLYHYTGATAGRELFLWNVPFFDPLSFPFLAYASWCVARRVLGRSRGPGVLSLSALLMMLLDVVMDPLAVRGGRWFLGHLFHYPEGGAWFGVPLSNFAGWFLVGFAIVGGHLGLTRKEPSAAPTAGVALYYAVLAFNLAITLWIGEVGLFATGAILHAAAAALLLVLERRGSVSQPPAALGFTQGLPQ
jgi:putative membrane protein